MGQGKIVGIIFAALGLGMLIGTFFWYRNTRSFLAEATRTEGTVIDLVGSHYRPIVHFTDRHGQEIEFTSSTGSNPPAYSIGQKVEVLYRPNEPQTAAIDSFFSLWGVSVILGGLGGVFFAIGAGIVLFVHS
jgi:hypothetical protein